jgi:hypothetical protein
MLFTTLPPLFGKLIAPGETLNVQPLPEASLTETTCPPIVMAPDKGEPVELAVAVS